MIRKLLIVFASGLVLSILLLSAAWVLGGEEFMNRARRDFAGWDFSGWDYEGGRHHGPDGPHATRSLAFDPGKPLITDVPMQLRFTRGDVAQMTVSGPRAAIDALQWQDGRLFAAPGVHFHHGLSVTITAPQLAAMTVDAPGEFDFEGLDQPALALTIRGPADIEAHGKVAALNIETHGPADVDLSGIEARDAKVRIDGVGSVQLNASGAVDASVVGVGSVVLHRKPASLQSHSVGIGGVVRDYDGNGDED